MQQAWLRNAAGMLLLASCLTACNRSAEVLPQTPEAINPREGQTCPSASVVILGVPDCGNVVMYQVNFTPPLGAGETATYSWDFGCAAEPTTSTTNKVPVTIAGPSGTHSGSVNVITSEGCNITANFQTTITNGCCPSTITAMITSPFPVQGSTFIAAASITGGLSDGTCYDPITYHWDFGGGASPNTGTDQNMTVVASGCGTFVGSLRAELSCGDTDTVNFVYTVQAPEGCACPTGGWAQEGMLDGPLGSHQTKVVVDSCGTSYIAGTYSDGSSGDPYLFVQKQDEAGTVEWTNAYRNQIRFSDMTINGAGEPVLLVGCPSAVILNGDLLEGEMFTFTISTDGNTISNIRGWANDGNVFVDHVFPFSIAMDDADNYYISGSFSTVNFGGGGRTSTHANDWFVFSLDSTTDYRWDYTVGSDHDPEDFENLDAATDLAVDNVFGGLLVRGAYEQSIDFGGGSRTATGVGNAGVRLALSDGSYEWDKAWAGGWPAAITYDDYDDTSAIATDPVSGAVLIGGVWVGAVDFGGGVRTSSEGIPFLVKYDHDGTYAWDRVWGQQQVVADGDFLNGVAVDGQGNVYCAARFDGSTDYGGGTRSTTGTDVSLVKLDSDGTHLWDLQLGTDDQDHQKAADVAVLSDGTAWIYGQYSGDVDFDPGTGVFNLPGSGGVFVAKYFANGAW